MNATVIEEQGQAGVVPGLLAGLRIIEVASFVAGPLGGMTLAQLGAEVIRIDPLGGASDVRRLPLSPDGTSLYWAGLNKGKRSLTVDLGSADGRELVAALVAGSGPGGGIVLTNVANQPWLSYEALRAHRPDLIHLTIQGRSNGQTAVDYTVNAAAGFSFVTGPEGHNGPVNHTLPAWDVACGLYAAVGLLAAERWRRLTGEGRQVRVALEDVALATAGNLGFLTEAQVNKIERDRYGNFVYGVFGTEFASRDGKRVMVVALTARHWRELVEVTGIGNVLGGLERELGVNFSEDVDRFRYREVIAGLLRPWFATRTAEEIETVLGATSLLWSRYRSFLEIAETGLTDLEANPMWELVDQPGIGPHLAPGSPLDTGRGARPVAPAPLLGQDTDAVLREVMRLSDAELVELRDRRIVA